MLDCCGASYTPIGEGKAVRNRRILWIVLIIVLIAAVAVGVTFIVLWKLKDNGSDDIYDRINIKDLMGHLNELESIAVANNNTRAAGTPGYNASVAYVLEMLKETDYDVKVQPFPFETSEVIGTPTFEAASPVFDQPFNLVYGTDFLVAGAWTLDGLLQGHLQYVTGCNASDWGNFTGGNIALIQRGSCTFVEMAQIAANNSASALIIFNSGKGANNVGLFGVRVGKSIPVFTTTYGLGLAMKNDDQITIKVNIQTVVQTKQTWNVLATTKQGRTDSVVVVGSHLDSVPAGPGINDNGSGSSLNLELALLTYRHLASKLQNQVMFAWWGAEELGLLGSTFYVSNLTQNDPQQLKTIALNLNFDMVGSPNFFRGIYNGSSGNDAIRQGSSVIQSLFEDAFNTQSLPWDLTEFSGRSDYGPFIAQNISAGGLFTGAEVPKTIEQWRNYGGLTNAAYDPCYHQACDTVENINQDAYLQMSEAAARVLQKLALEPDLRSFLGEKDV